MAQMVRELPVTFQQLKDQDMHAQDVGVSKIQGGQINHDQLCDYLHDQQMQGRDGDLQGRIVGLSLSSSKVPNQDMPKC